MKFHFRPRALPLDWMTVTMRVPCPGWRPFTGDEVAITDAMTLVRHHGRTKVFNRIDVLQLDNGSPLGILASDPHSEVTFKRDQVQLKVDNAALYSDAWVDLFTELVEVLGWEPIRVDQLDLAADGHGLADPFRAYADRRVAYGGRADVVIRYANDAFKAAEVGQRGGKKFMRVYNKSNELKITRKAYIRSYWGRMGIVDDGKVERAEVSVKGPELRRYAPDATGAYVYDFMRSLVDPMKRAELFQSMTWTLARFRPRDGGRKDRRDDLVQFDWTGIGLDAPMVYAREPEHVDLGEAAVKGACRMLYLCHLAMRPPDLPDDVAADPGGWAARAEALATAAGLGPWYRRTRATWAAQFDKFTERGRIAPQLFANLPASMQQAEQYHGERSDP